MTITEFMAGVQTAEAKPGEPRYISSRTHTAQRTAETKRMILSYLRAGEPIDKVLRLAIGIPAESDPAWAMQIQAELEDYAEPVELDYFALARKIYHRYHDADLQSREVWQEISDIAGQSQKTPKLMERLIAAVINTLQDEARAQAEKKKVRETA